MTCHGATFCQRALSRRRLLVLPLLILALHGLAAADVAITVGADSEAFLGQLASLQLHPTVLPTQTGHFPENTQSFVRLYHPTLNPRTVSVVHQKVWIQVPAKLTYDLLMELLIKVRSAQTFGAASIHAFAPCPLAQVELIPPPGDLPPQTALSLEHLLMQAGCQQVWEGKSSRWLQTPVSSPARVAAAPALQKSSVAAPFWIAGHLHTALRDEVAQLLGQTAYAFAELQQHPEQLLHQRIYWIASAIPPVNDTFFTLLAQVHFLVQHGAEVIWIAPYLPYARSDKPEFQWGVASVGKLAADLMEGSGIQGIKVVRAHAPQSLAFFKIFAEELTGRPTLIAYLLQQQIDCIVSPDAGFQKDATLVQLELEQAYQAAGTPKTVCLAVMNKRRSFDAKEVLVGGTGLEALIGKKVAILDDETASGGTLDQVAKFLHHSFPPQSILAMVTHLAGHAQKSLNSSYLQALVVTNTLPLAPYPRLHVLSVAPEIAASILRDEEK